MANYSIVVGSKFNPLSFEDYLKPHQMYKEEYDKLADEYDTLEAQAAAFKNLANQDTNPDAYNLFNAVNTELESMAKTLESGKIDRESARKLKRMYNSNIIPIATAAAHSKEYMDLMSKNPDKVYADKDSQGRSFIGLDAWLSGETPDYSKTLVTSDLSNKAANSLYAGILESMNTKGIDNFGDYISNPSNVGEVNLLMHDILNSVDTEGFSDTGKATIQQALELGMNSTLSKLAEVNVITAYQKAQLEQDDRRLGQQAYGMRMDQVLNGLNSDLTWNDTNPKSITYSIPIVVDINGTPTTVYHYPNQEGVVKDANGNLITNPSVINSVNSQVGAQNNKGGGSGTTEEKGFRLKGVRLYDSEGKETYKPLAYLKDKVLLEFTDLSFKQQDLAMTKYGNYSNNLRYFIDDGGQLGVVDKYELEKGNLDSVSTNTSSSSSEGFHDDWD